MSEVNPYAVLLAKAKALPRQKQMFLSAKFRDKTTDTEKPCGCLFGQICPRGLGDWWTEALNVDNRAIEVPYFRRWLKKAGLPLASASRAERYNDAYMPFLNTAEECKERYRMVVTWLEEQAAKWEETPEFDAGGLT